MEPGKIQCPCTLYLCGFLTAVQLHRKEILSSRGNYTYLQLTVRSPPINCHKLKTHSPVHQCPKLARQHNVGCQLLLYDLGTDQELWHTAATLHNTVLITYHHPVKKFQAQSAVSTECILLQAMTRSNHPDHETATNFKNTCMNESLYPAFAVSKFQQYLASHHLKGMLKASKNRNSGTSAFAEMLLCALFHLSLCHLPEHIAILPESGLPVSHQRKQRSLGKAEGH